MYSPSVGGLFLFLDACEFGDDVSISTGCWKGLKRLFGISLGGGAPGSASFSFVGLELKLVKRAMRV